MPGVLTLASNVKCGHGPGKVSTSSSAKLKVSGSAVLLESGISGKAVVFGSCGITPSDKSSKCTQVSSVTAGRATKLKAGGRPVMLDSLAGQTDGKLESVTPQPLLAATAGQTKLTAS
jgi:hypothetical protein